MGIKMEKVILEKQGRVLIPKNVRDELGLRSGEEMSLQVEKDKIILKLFKNQKEFSSQLKGCVKESKIDPLELKKIWKM